MSNTILFVFEGKNIEGQIFNSIKTNFFPPPNSNVIIRSSFCAEIFQLYNKVKDDVYLDIVQILKERQGSGIDNLNRNDVSEVHLFFDHDAHFKPNISQEEYHQQVLKLIDTFNNEFEMGKLWISYPMAEAIKHCKKNINECFFDTKMFFSDNINYKKIVAEKSDFNDIRKYDLNTWHYLAAINIQRTFRLVENDYKAIFNYDEIKGWFNENGIIVKIIQEKQYFKFINPKNEVVTLSSFPLFLLYYFGESFFYQCKCDDVIKTCSFYCYQ